MGVQELIGLSAGGCRTTDPSWAVRRQANHTPDVTQILQRRMPFLEEI
jgi:hypothetical protein